MQSRLAEIGGVVAISREGGRNFSVHRRFGGPEPLTSCFAGPPSWGRFGSGGKRASEKAETDPGSAEGIAGGKSGEVRAIDL